MTQAAREQLRIWGFVTAVVLILIVEVISLAKNPGHELLVQELHNMDLKIVGLTGAIKELQKKPIPPPEQVQHNNIVDARLDKLERRIDEVLREVMLFINEERGR